MHCDFSTRTIPCSSRHDAPVGQTSMHGASSQCWHDWRKKWYCVSLSLSVTGMCAIDKRLPWAGTWLVLRHARAQILQPLHRDSSWIMAYRTSFSCLVFANREDAEPVKKITVPNPRTNLRRVKDIWLSPNAVAATVHPIHDISLKFQGFWNCSTSNHSHKP